MHRPKNGSRKGTNPGNNQPRSHANDEKGRRRRRNSNESSTSNASENSTETTLKPNKINKNRSRLNRRNHRASPARKKQQLTKAQIPEPEEFLALDCEMVGVGPGGHQSSVARITVVDWFGHVVLDEYIQQTEAVTDYRTFVSGITEQQLDAATLSLDDCRQQLEELLQDRILVGHALKNDMKALNLQHPWWLVRDTAKYEPFQKVRFDDGVLWPRKLRDLVQEKLNKEIQVPGRPHSPEEDAIAALELYQSVQENWEQIMSYKVEKTRQIMLKQQQVLSPTQ